MASLDVETAADWGLCPLGCALHSLQTGCHSPALVRLCTLTSVCMLPLQSGGAGVPFYVGNARCPTCAGQGFCPCPMCVGYRLPLPKPDPANGPPPVEPADILVSTQRWLRSFPDSRTLAPAAHAAAVDSGSSGRAVTEDSERSLTVLNEEQMQVLCAEAAFCFYAWRARLDGRGRPVRQ